MMYVLDLTIDGLTPLNSAAGLHWRKRKKLKDLWHQLVRAHVGRDKPPKPLAKARVSITRCSSQECDFDNLVSSGKFLLDGLTHAGVIEDDKMSVIGQPSFAWQKASPKRGKMLIMVEELE